MYVCVCAFPPTKVRSVSVWPPRRTPARDTGARSKAFSSRSAALLYLCSTGVPSRRAVRRSRSGLHSRARPVTCIRGRSPSTPRSAPRQNTQPNSSSPSSYRGPFLSCPRPRFPPPPRRRDPQRARPSRRRTERPMRSRARQVPRGSVREFGWRLRSRLRALSSQPPRAPVADPRFFPSPCSPRCVPPERRGGGLFSHSSTRFFYLVSILRESQFGRISEELRFGCVVPRHFGAFLGNENFRKVMNQLRF